MLGFVAEEARIACNPISFFHAFKQAKGSSEKIQKRLKASAPATSTGTPKGRHLKIKKSHKDPQINNSDAQTSLQMKCHFW